MKRRVLAVALGMFAACALLASQPSRAADEAPVPKGERVFSAGHSFHVFMPGILNELAKSGGIKDHKHLGTSSIGGSRTIQHWDQPDDKNKTKTALKTGEVDVLTLSPIFHPDAGIDNFTKLALEHNPKVRVLVQAFWLPFDVYDRDYQKKRPEKVDRNARTVAEMKKVHADYFVTVDEQVNALNKAHGKTAVFVVPVGQAAILLRERIIAGTAPGLKAQEDLFSDPIGHARAPLQALTAYCHYAVIYKRSPVGLPAPAVLKNAKNPDWDEKLNKLLQELAWDAVTAHPLSGVKADDPKLEPGTVELFNGKDLTGWGYQTKDKFESFDGETEASDKRYSAKDGILVVNPGKGTHQLWTAAKFPKDFELRLEFRAAENADSGLFVRGPQLQVRDYLVAGPYKELKKYKPQDWNEIVVIVKGEVAHCTCNGELLNDKMKVPATGPIGLEADRGQMEYRKIRLKELK